MLQRVGLVEALYKQSSLDKDFGALPHIVMTLSMLLYPAAKPPTPPQWKALVWPLQTDTWLGLGAAFISATLVLSALSRPGWNGNPHFEWADCESAYL